MSERAMPTMGGVRIESDAQGPCMLMHPTEAGVAVANFGVSFKPANGYHEPCVDDAVPCVEAMSGVTYRPERVANVLLCAAAFQAATAAASMGFDPIGCIQALPKLLAEVVKINKREGWQSAYDALSAARTRQEVQP